MPVYLGAFDSNHLLQLKGKFGGYEIPRQLILVDEPFIVDNGMLPHTMQLKRRKVLDRYKDHVDLAYESS
ncbi:hypothetical protein [Desulfogranum marinum]|uniref:hypothetical protein n=1 Tax=Desulfogranum marinum TaxID=453220 RepID=UPI001964A7AB|nr:hypothetical protein [Desulfogranum marinum]MBM9515203.1 hypothetical protein [Desulfogranum marinum]